MLNGCIGNTASTLTVNPLPNITATNTTVICYNGSAVLTASGGTSYTWTPGGVGSSITVSPTSNTVYNVVGTNSLGCTNSAAASVTVLTLPSITANTVTICNGNTGTLTASSGTTYTWSSGSTLNTMTASPSANTNYKCYH